MFSWTVKAIAKTRATPRTIWQQCIQFEHIPLWDVTMEWCKLNGPLQVGVTGQAKLKSQKSPLQFTVTHVEPEHLYQDESKVIGSTFNFRQQLEPVEGGTLITHSIKVSGLTAPILALLMKNSLHKSLNQSLHNFVRLIEGKKA
jgi:hypothetical protein